MPLDQATRRLKAIQDVFSSDSYNRFLLPDLAEVRVDNGSIWLEGRLLSRYVELPRAESLALSAIGTVHEASNPMPKYAVLEIHHEEALSPESMWITIYALFSVKRLQEMIPINLQPLTNAADVENYLLISGLGRHHPHPTEDIYLSRSAFWQGAGCSAHQRGWLREYSQVVANFPTVDSFTRSSSVITSHPLRPPKPPPGALLYRRYCPAVSQLFEIHYININDDNHFQTFHRWHNSPRVNEAWGEAGSVENHKAYITKQMEDPHVWPLMASWDGELMGYFEITWVKEDHVSQYIPGGGQPYDRGIHLLVGEEKFRGRERARAWMTSMVHYIFISEPRTSRLVGEPKLDNAAVIAVSVQSEYHVETDFDLPHKRSSMTDNLRERFFKRPVLP